jgi:hypothetical protein
MKTEEELIAQMQRYAKQIHDRAMAGQKPGAALANYMRTLKEWDALRDRHVFSQGGQIVESMDDPGFVG